MRTLFKVLLGLAVLGTGMGVVSAELEKKAKKAEAELDAIVEQLTDMAVDASMEFVDEEYSDLCNDWKEEN